MKKYHYTEEETYLPLLEAIPYFINQNWETMEGNRKILTVESLLLCYLAEKRLSLKDEKYIETNINMMIKSGIKKEQIVDFINRINKGDYEIC